MAGTGGYGATDAVPTEDAVQALVDHFVSDLLPNRPSTSEPPDDHQLLIANQMHLVVLLYNYYHRKQFPDLELLSFEAFCKVAVISKPSLLSYLKFMRACGEELRDLNKQLSITERMISNACNICKTLDATIDLPTMESWPISKITVFLVDATREICLLEFCTIAKGVWSLVEKDLSTLCDDLVCRSQMENHMSDKERAINGSLVNISSEVEEALNRLALSTVEGKTGIKKSNLIVLEHHRAYSLSQEKTTARLYIMMYTKAVNKELVNGELTEVPMRDLLSSLRGTLFKKGTFCGVTPVVNYCYLLPYVNILSDWLSRETSCDVNSFVVGPQADIDENYSSKLESPIKCLEAENKLKWSDQTANTLSKRSKIDETVNEQTDGSSSLGTGYKPPDTADGFIEPDKLLAVSVQAANDKTLQREVTRDTISNYKSTGTTGSFVELDRLATMGVQARSDRPFQRVVTRDTTDNPPSIINDSMEQDKLCTMGVRESVKPFESAVTRDSSMEPNRLTSVSVRAIIDKPSPRAETKDIPINEKLRVDTAGKNEGADGTFMNELTKAVSNKKADSSFQTHREQLSHHVQDVTVRQYARLGVQTNETDMISCHIPQSGSKNKFTFENHDSFQPVTVPQKNYLLQASLQSLQKKLAELCQQQCLLEEEVAICEMKMHTLINGGEDALESNAEFIIEACGNLCSRQPRAGGAVCSELRQLKMIKRRRLSEAVLSLQSQCQELDDICSENSWILPKYSVLPSFADGRYQASITLQGMDFEFTGNGDLKASPREARESAAFHMLSRLRSIAGQAQ